MSRCPEIDYLGGDQCRLEAGHAGKHKLEDPPEPNDAERARMQREMNADLRPLVRKWRRMRVPWPGIAGFLLAEVAAAYDRCGIDPGRIPIVVAKVIFGDETVEEALAAEGVDEAGNETQSGEASA